MPVRFLIAFMCAWTIQALAAQEKPEKPRQFIYVLRLVPRLHSDSAWTREDEAALERHFNRFISARI